MLVPREDVALRTEQDSHELRWGAMTELRALVAKHSALLAYLADK
jgi:hypothetical protein